MLVTALLAVFGYIGPFWQIIDPWRARGPSSAFLDDGHLSQDVLPGVALQGYRYFWRSSQLLYLIFLRRKLKTVNTVKNGKFPVSRL